MSQSSGVLSSSAYAIEDNVRLGGSRFLGVVEVSGRQGRVYLSGRRVPVWWLWFGWAVRLVSAVVDELWGWSWWDLRGVEPRQPEEDPDSRSTSLRKTAQVSWSAGRSELVGKYTSCIDGDLNRRRVVFGRHRAYELRPVDVNGPYIVLQVKVPIGLGASMRLLQLEISADREQPLRRALSGVGN